MNQEQGSTTQATPEETTQEKLGWLLPQYRLLRAENAAIQEKMDELKQQIIPLVESVGGEFQDDLGSAKLNQRKAAVSYKSADVDKLVQSWLISQESHIRTCGEMLQVHRTTRKGTTYLQVK